MQKLIIKGKRELNGKISISGSKNATLPILAASILANKVHLKNVPLVKDIFTMVELLNFIGLKRCHDNMHLENKVRVIQDVARFIKTYTKYLQTQKPVMDLYHTQRFRDWMRHQLSPLK